MGTDDLGSPEAAVERAMVAIRRSQSRRRLSRLARRQGWPEGVPTSEAALDVLDIIEAAEESGVPVTVTEVAEALSIDQPRASKLVAAAVKAGFVRRMADQADGRRALLVATDEGRAFLHEVHEFRRQVFSAAMSDWSPTERAEFARLLTRCVRALGNQQP